MNTKARPNNHPLHKPPALSTRGSATELYVAPDFISLSPRHWSVPETSTSFQYPSQQPTISTGIQPSQPSVISAAYLPIMATSSVSQLPAAATSTMPVIIDSTFAPSVFRGLPSDDAEMWLAVFEKYVNFRHMSPKNKLTFFPVLLKNSASDWYNTLVLANLRSHVCHRHVSCYHCTIECGCLEMTLVEKRTAVVASRWQKPGYQPVSYTHLTLPTNREV